MALTFHTSLGDLKVELACAEAPRLCENLLALAASGEYDGTTFHRNIRAFLVQGGDRTGTGKGGDAALAQPAGAAPGKLADEFHPLLKHDARGVVSMANSGPGTNGAQFFVTYAPQPTLDGVYCVVGRLLGSASMDTLDAMERAPVEGKKFRPVTPIVIRGVTIHANPFAQP